MVLRRGSLPPSLFAQLVVGFSSPLAAHWKSLWTSVGRFLNLDLRSDQALMVSFFTLGNGRGNLAPTIGHTSHKCQQNLHTCGSSIAFLIQSLDLFAQLVVGFSNPLAAHWKSLWTSVGRFLNLDLRSDQAQVVSFFTLGNGRGNLAPTIGHTSHKCQQNLHTCGSSIAAAVRFLDLSVRLIPAGAFKGWWAGEFYRTHYPFA